MRILFVRRFVWLPEHSLFTDPLGDLLLNAHLPSTLINHWMSNPVIPPIPGAYLQYKLTTSRKRVGASADEVSPLPGFGSLNIGGLKSESGFASSTSLPFPSLTLDTSAAADGEVEEACAIDDASEHKVYLFDVMYRLNTPECIRKALELYEKYYKNS